ncbi:MAG TPA: hypothetical protein PLQ54_19570 [Armatimonadota bacterium]|nr:hypothetical protein [Armatimonadota bacterium]
MPAVAALLWLGPVWAVDDAGDAAPAPEQWIAALPDDLGLPVWGWREYGMARWVIWPSDDDVAERQPPRDRSEPVGDPDGQSGKPHELLCPPGNARSEALSWVRELLKPEWAPPDLEDCLTLLQEEDPAESSVVCRFEIDGTGIQIAQRRWAMCVVVKPSPALSDGVPGDQMGPALMRALFARGDAMAEVPATDRHDLAPGLWLGGYVAGEGDGRGGGPRWWHWKAWYTDGLGVAIYFSKLSFDRKTSYLPGNPWF